MRSKDDETQDWGADGLGESLHMAAGKGTDRHKLIPVNDQTQCVQRENHKKKGIISNHTRLGLVFEPWQPEEKIPS